MQLLDKNGQPLKINTKTILLALAMGFGGFTGGATFPDLNPLNLFESTCDKQ
jgi:hypothetical protein